MNSWLGFSSSQERDQMLQQYKVVVSTPQQGPKGGKKPDLVQTGYVAAESKEAALAALHQECPTMFSQEGVRVAVVPTECAFVWSK